MLGPALSVHLTERLLAAALTDIDAPIQGELDLTQQHPSSAGYCAVVLPDPRKTTANYLLRIHCEVF
jgi:hypothetical protein